MIVSVGFSSKKVFQVFDDISKWHPVSKIKMDDILYKDLTGLANLSGLLYANPETFHKHKTFKV